MATVKISALTELTTTAATDELVIVDKSSSTTKRITVSNLIDLPTAPAGIADNTNKEYNLKLTDVSGTETLTWVEETADDVVDDTSPQLGGFLDANDNYIQTQKGGNLTSASPLVIDTDGDYFDVTGVVSFAVMTVAVDRQFTLQFNDILTMTHHATNLDLPGEANITTAAGDVATFQSTAANKVQCINYTRATGESVVGIANVVDDLTPQLGGMLDVHGQAIGDGTLELLKFSETASAINEFTIANAAIGNAPVLSATGGDDNIGITLTPKGTGDVNLSADTVQVGDNNVNATITTQGTGDLILNTNS